MAAGVLQAVALTHSYRPVKRATMTKAHPFYDTAQLRITGIVDFAIYLVTRTTSSPPFLWLCIYQCSVNRLLRG
jgi:hypothetical protein